MESVGCSNSSGDVSLVSDETSSNEVSATVGVVSDYADVADAAESSE